MSEIDTAATFMEYRGVKMRVHSFGGTYVRVETGDPLTLEATARSADGAPLMFRGSAPDAVGPGGDPTVQAWKTWLDGREKAADV